VPVDPDIPYLSAISGSCSQLLQTEARLSTVDLRPFLTQTKDTDIVVESWCIRCKNARELLEEETSTLISFQGGPVEQEPFSMLNENQYVSFAKKCTGNLADLSR